ncbi:MAG TPA: undecaprenyldiphospho-muramoylpentapeptide beta-N-acetylglucosaminyltransferase [Thermoanaerobaculia bacterium]
MTGELGTYVIAAGGTGGHIVPGIALANEIRSRRPTAAVLFVGTAYGLESRLVPEAGFPLELIEASGFVGKTLGKRLRALAQLPGGFTAARALLRRHKARVVIGVGGYVSIPVVMAARSLGIPTVIHESNALPGVANKFLNRFASKTAVGIAAANKHFKKPGVVTGTPVRPEFFEIPPVDPEASTKRVLVFGGSQGSRVINRAVARAAVMLEKKDFEVIHQTGEKDLTGTRQRYARLPQKWKLEAFLPHLHREMTWADLVICRAGAMTVSELIAAGRPAILIPFAASAGGHQLANAKALARAGTAVVIEEGNLSGETLAGTITELLADRAKLAEMGAKARALAKPGAAKELATLVFGAETMR